MLHDWIKNLPTAYRRDPWLSALFSALDAADARTRENADEMAAQMFLDTMTYQLAVEEREADIVPPIGATLDDRRAVLSARWRAATGKADLAQIQSVCDAVKPDEVRVAYDGTALVFRFIGTLGVPPADELKRLTDAIGTVAPAHLAQEFIYRVLTVGEMERMTVAAVDKMQIRSFGV